MLEEKLTNDMKQAMKDKDAAKLSTIRLVIADCKKTKIDKQLEKLEDSDIVAVLKKQVKQRQDSIEQFEKAGRTDLSEKEKLELAIIKTYLPEELSREELEKLVADAITETGAASMKEMGAVMKAVLEKAAGRADNKTVSGIVKQKLS